MNDIGLGHWLSSRGKENGVSSPAVERRALTDGNLGQLVEEVSGHIIVTLKILTLEYKESSQGGFISLFTVSNCDIPDRFHRPRELGLDLGLDV